MVARNDQDTDRSNTMVSEMAFKKPAAVVEQEKYIRQGSAVDTLQVASQDLALLNYIQGKVIWL